MQVVPYTRMPPQPGLSYVPTNEEMQKLLDQLQAGKNVEVAPDWVIQWGVSLGVLKFTAPSSKPVAKFHCRKVNGLPATNPLHDFDLAMQYAAAIGFEAAVITVVPGPKGALLHVLINEDVEGSTHAYGAASAVMAELLSFLIQIEQPSPYWRSLDAD